MNGNVAWLALASVLAAQQPETRAIDASKSSARFSISHIWVDRVSGTVPILDGIVTLSPGSLIPTRVSATLDASKISTGEPDRDRSLESPDFFDAAKYPRWSFASTQIVPAGPNAFEMDGNLTIHGVSRPERLQVTVRGTPADPEYRATAEIDRHAFGMAVTRLDPTIGSTADVTLDVVLR